MSAASNGTPGVPGSPESAGSAATAGPTESRAALAPPAKLGLAAGETSEQLARRFERERLAVARRRECDLDRSLHPFRVGSTPYLNTVPLTRGLEDQILFLPPAALAERLRAGELDAALVSVAEVLLHDGYEVLDEIAVASLGEVKSVFLAHREPLDRIQTIHCDPASLTSVRLLQVLLAERGLKPVLRPLESYEPRQMPDAALLIGDPALHFLVSPHDHQILDLGAAWFEMTGLPFVYAVWALRRNAHTQPLRRLLREARDFGLDTLDDIVRTRTEYTPEFRNDYLGWHIHFYLGADEKRGLARFMALLDAHGLGPTCAPRFVL
jgi:chorismate dehydratase